MLRCLKNFFILGLLTSTQVWAQLSIFDMRKTLALSDNEKVYRDFYVNGGSEAGLNAGMVVTVYRRQPLYDSYQNRAAGDLHLKVARVKIIHVQKGLAVARLHTEFTRDNSPLLEDNFIMIGDMLDMNTAGPESKPGTDEKRAETPVHSAPTPTEVKSAALESVAPPTPIVEPIAPQQPVPTPQEAAPAAPVENSPIEAAPSQTPIEPPATAQNTNLPKILINQVEI